MKRSAYFPKLFEPAYIGKLKIKNRIVMSPMGLHYHAGVSGEVTDYTIAYYAERARGGTGLILVGLTDPMTTPQRVTVPYLSLGEDRFKRGHCYLVEAVHAAGAKIGIQFAHLGAQLSVYAHGGRQTVSPSGVQIHFVDGHAYEPPRAMNRAEIYEVIECIAAAAGRARDAGYDLVEVHAAHGYLINEFMSPRTNKRTDEFGGTLPNRMRFLLEIIKRIRDICGSTYPIGIRISADEFLDDGITLAESPAMAKMIEAAGAAVLNVSSGTYETLHKSNDIMRMQEGWKRPIWAAIKKAVNIPTIAGGGNRTPELCEKIVAEGVADFVGFGRQTLADPEWPNKAMEGRVEDIRKCTSCLECLYGAGGIPRVAPRCTVNPRRGREMEWAELKPAAPKKVMIVGAGPGGMEAARVASLRGHDVTIYDSENELGGHLLLAAAPPGKYKWLWLRDYLVTQLKKQGVKTKLGVTVTPELVELEKPDFVVIATGGEPFVPMIPGIEQVKGKELVSAWDVLQGKVALKNRKVVILGGGQVGCETAEFLAEKGNQVTIVEMLSTIAGDMDPMNRRGLLDQLQQYKVNILTGLEVKEVTAKGADVINRQTGEKRFIEADAMVLAMGTRPLQDLAEALEEKDIKMQAIGDCCEPRKIINAMYEGSLAGRQI